jgi:hypothetical protein
MGATAKRSGAPEPPKQEGGWRAFARWSGIDDPEADAGLPEPDTGAQPQRGPGWLPLALLVGLYVLSTLVYILIGRGQELPQVSPDEYQYSALARSVADGNGLTYNGGPIAGELRAALYIYAIAPAWIVTDSITQSYAIVKALGAIMICAVVFPTWLLARRFMPPLLALVPAVLMVAGSWMTSSSQMIMENLALPLAAASLAALVAALSRPGSRWGWVALAFALIATWSRAQLALLIPLILLALLLDVALTGRSWRGRLRSHGPLAAVLGTIALVGGIAVLADPGVLGSYRGLTSGSDLSNGIPLVGRQAIAYIAMAAVLPFAIALAISLRRRAWDEAQLRPLLTVFWVSTATLVIGTGFLTTGFQTVDWSIQRYVEYSLPLLYVLVVAGIWRSLVATRLMLIATGIVAVVLLFTPAIQNIQEQRGTFGPLRRADTLLGLGPGITMALIALIAGGGTLLAVRYVRSRSARTVMLTAVLAFTGMVFAVQNQAGWAWQLEQSQVWRDGFPKKLSWIDAATDRPLARMVFYYNPFKTPQTEFFNRRIVRTYVPESTAIAGTPVNGFSCGWRASQSGAVTFDSRCGPSPTAFFQNDDLAKVTYYDQSVVAQERHIGRVVEIDVRPPSRVRIKTLIKPPCLAPIATQDLKTGDINPPSAVCGPSIYGAMYLDDPATVRVRFRGGPADQSVQAQGSWGDPQQAVNVPAGETTDVKLEVPVGTSQWQITFSWQGGQPPDVPEVTSVLMEQGGERTELLY